MRYESDKETLVEKLSTEREKVLKDCEKRVTATEARLRDALVHHQEILEERKLQHQEVRVYLPQKF